MRVIREADVVYVVTNNKIVIINNNADVVKIDKDTAIDIVRSLGYSVVKSNKRVNADIKDKLIFGLKNVK